MKILKYIKSSSDTTSEKLKKLDEFKNEPIEEEKRRTVPKYRDTVKTIRDALDYRFADNIEYLEKCIRNNDTSELNLLKSKFLENAKDYVAPWYDEDLDMMRSGYDWESNFYKRLASLC